MNRRPQKAARSADELAGPETFAAMTGREFIEKIRDGELPGAPIGETLDFWIEEVGDGRVVFRSKPGFKGYNPAGAMHGGWYGTLLDSCMACAVQTKLAKGQAYTTLEYKVNLVRAVFADTEEVLAIGEVDHVGRRTGVATGRIVGAESGKLYATGSTTCLILDL